MKTVVYVGQAYYNSWLLRTEISKLGWKSLLIDLDVSGRDRNYYWGQDVFLPEFPKERLELFLDCINQYKFFHFANRDGIYFLNFHSDNASVFEKKIKTILFHLVLFFLRLVFYGRENRFLNCLRFFGLIKISDNKINLNTLLWKKISPFFTGFYRGLPRHWDIYLLKALGKKIIYSNNGCHDGVGPSAFSKWGPYNVCETVCPWFGTSVCTDEGSQLWGEYRNAIADYQITLGGNRAEYNLINTVHEVPEFYCLDDDHWKTELQIPKKYLLSVPEDTFKIYHSVGNFDMRTKKGVNIKSTHIYLALIEELKHEGYKVELVFCKDVPNKDVRYVMHQCDVAADMLTFGWFGANMRESMMMGKPSICFIRPEWLESMKLEIPEYVEELPIISATPETIKNIVIDLIKDKALRQKIGQNSREFALKWHSKKAGAIRMSKIYSSLV